MTSQLIASACIAPTPWRNGGGRTRELLTWPSAADWALRISVADIDADGPFSPWPGVMRGFAILEGAGVRLRFADREVTLDSGSPACHFDGAEAPACHLLDGPTRDLNVMTRHGGASLTRAVAGRRWAPAAAARRAGFYSLAGGWWRSAGGAAHHLPAHALLWWDEPVAAPWHFEPDAAGAPTGWWIGHDPDAP